MRNPASFKIVKGPKALWSKKTDSHNEIELEHGIPVNTAETIYNVSVEITPPNDDFSQPLSALVFRVDQDRLPKWWDAAEAEEETRRELVKWADAKLRQAGNNRDVVDGDNVLAICGGTVSEIRGGTVSFNCSFSVKLSGLLSVVINRIGNTARCYVGTEKVRVVKG